MQILFTSVTRALRQSLPLTARLLRPTAPPRFLTTTTTTTTKMGSNPTTTGGKSDAFLSLIQSRRSIYPLNKTLPIPAARIQTIISELLQHVPSSFNSQSNRVVVLFGAEHDRFWDITSDILKAIVPADAWEATGNKMAMFKAAGGTALFFEDQAPVEAMQAKFAAYADRYVYIPSSNHSPTCI
jgi:predicted oxidoreductase (fatty acid repression mutant protein)